MSVNTRTYGCMYVCSNRICTTKSPLQKHINHLADQQHVTIASFNIAIVAGHGPHVQSDRTTN